MQTNAATAAANWVSGISRSTQRVTAGVQAVQTAPQQKAAAAVGKWQAALADPATAAKYVNNLSRQSLSDWQQPMLQKGIQRMASGAQASQGKFQTFMTQFLPFLQGVTQQVHAMPSTTLEDRINRMVAQARGVSAFKRQ